MFALNGDELLDVDLAALLGRHRETGAAATIAVAQPPSAFGVVDLDADDVVTGFREAGRIPYWVNCGVYVLGPEALARFPERGDHETTGVPGAGGRAQAARVSPRGHVADRQHAKDLRRAEEHVAEHPEWLAA